MAQLNPITLLMTCLLAGLAASAHIQSSSSQEHNSNFFRRRSIAAAHPLHRRNLQSSHHEVRSLQPRAKTWKSFTLSSPSSSSKASSKASSLVDTHSSLGRVSAGSAGSGSSGTGSAPGSPKSYASAPGSPASSSSSSSSSGYSSSSSALRRPLLGGNRNSQETGIQEYSPAGSLIGARHGPSSTGQRQALLPPHADPHSGAQGIQERPTGIQEYISPSKRMSAAQNAQQAPPSSAPGSLGGAEKTKARSGFGFKSFFGGSRARAPTNTIGSTDAGTTPGDLSSSSGSSSTSSSGPANTKSKGGFFSRFRGKSAPARNAGPLGSPVTALGVYERVQYPIGGGEYVFPAPYEK